MIIANYFKPNKEQEFEISGLIGPEYQWASQLSISQIFCSKMVIHRASRELIENFPNRSELVFGTIEIRPGGALIQLSQGDRATAWCIPFHHLSVVKSECWEIHSNGLCVKLIDPSWSNKNFISILMNHKRSATEIEMN